MQNLRIPVRHDRLSQSSLLKPDRQRPEVGSFRPARWCWLLLCLPLALLLELLARYLPGFAEGYAQYVYPVLAQPLNFLTGLLPFSLMEWVCAGAAFWLLVVLVRFILHLVHAAAGRLQLLCAVLLKLLCAAGVALLAFVLLAGINYYRNTFTFYSGLTVQPSTVQELQTLCEDLAGQADALAGQIPVRDEAGVAVTTDEGGFSALAKTVDCAYDLIEPQFPVLGGSYGHAKPMLASMVMSRSQLTGIFFPFTMESNVNALAPSFNLPFTVAHELAHLRGFMREDEANYIAYRVCTVSPDVRLQYSGVLMALIHAGNQLAKVDGEAYAELTQGYSETVRRDLAQNNVYWAQFDEEPLSRLSETTNNAYLKANGQADGTQSYGRMVDLLLAQWRQERQA